MRFYLYVGSGGGFIVYSYFTCCPVQYNKINDAYEITKAID